MDEFDAFVATCSTEHWLYAVCFLLRVCYERCPINPTAATFLLSAMWHGVYPGYYLTFLTGIGMTMAARAVSTEHVAGALFPEQTAPSLCITSIKLA